MIKATSQPKQKRRRLRLTIEFASVEEMEMVKDQAREQNQTYSNYFRVKADLPPLNHGGYRVGQPREKAVKIKKSDVSKKITLKKRVSKR